jgi:hypothetical protein
MMKTLQGAAFAFPVPNREVYEIELRDTAKIRDRETRIEYGLQTHVLAFRRQEAHLEKALVRPPLNLDQIGNLNDAGNFGEINPLTDSAVPAVTHSCCSSLADSPTAGDY